MASKQPKKKESAGRVGSASKQDQGTPAVSTADKKTARQQIIIWPEWSDADINAEKWDAAHKGKEKEKGKSPSAVSHYFDDPDGRIDFPTIIKPAYWKRPQDHIMEKTPVIVDDPNSNFDLISANEHLHQSELMRWMVSQIMTLYRLAMQSPAEVTGMDGMSPWKPWEHIYSLCKVGKGPHQPLYNAYGKYVVRLYWMGCWRRIIIDDCLPFDDCDNLLLPATTLTHELWPVLLCKAMIKAASLDYNGGEKSCEFGDVSFVQLMTGWLPEPIPLKYGLAEEVWNLLKQSLNEFKLPEPEVQCVPQLSLKKGASDELKDSKKDDKSKGKDKKEKEKSDHKGAREATPAAPSDKPKVIAYISYCHPPPSPVRISKLGEMADASERLRQTGLSHVYPHPLLITRTRSCPLVAPPVPPPVPRWKLIRQRKKKVTPVDQPVEPELKRPDQWLEITSPYLNYKVSPMPLPTETRRTNSALSRGGSRTGSLLGGITENDEDNGDREGEAIQPGDATKEAEIQPAPILITTEPVVGAKLDAKDADRPKTEKQSGPAAPGADRPHSRDSRADSGKRLVDSVSVARSVSSAAKKLEERSRKSTSGKAGSKSSISRDGKPDQAEETVSGEERHPDDQPSTPQTDCNHSGPDLAYDNNTHVVQKTNDVWMHYDDFIKCFRTLYVFHKPATYCYSQKLSDFKVSGGAGHSAKKSSPGSAPEKVMSGTNQARGSPSPPHSYDERTPQFLFVDNIKPVEILVSFSTLCKWLEPVSLREKEHSFDGLTTSASSCVEGPTSGKEPLLPPSIQPGVLVAEPYSWKSLVTGQPKLCISTSGCRAAMLQLPPGRHVLRVMLNAPLGWHVHLCSKDLFVFGDEETVMPYLTKESCRFVDHAVNVLKSVGRAISVFGDQEQFNEAMKNLEDSHNPTKKDKIDTTLNIQAFRHALYTMAALTLNDNYTFDVGHALRALTFDLQTKCMMDFTPKQRDETTDPPPVETGGPGKKSQQATAPPPQTLMTPTAIDKAAQEAAAEKWNTDVSNDDLNSIVKLQTEWRGVLVRKIVRARTAGSDENMKVKEILTKLWTTIETNLETQALQLFRTMFKLQPDQMKKFPFHQDEWNKIVYSDYSGTYGDQSTNVWFVMFRGVFHVEEPILLVPKLYVSLPTCMLSVINNDTGEEIPCLFQRVAPHIYHRNTRGYTFFGDARTTDFQTMGGKWRMRLIGSNNPLPQPLLETVTSSFQTEEIKDYYLPNNKNIILRYSVTVSEDHLVSVQMCTSSPDVYLKLQILDNESEVLSATGKGHTVLPAYIFLKDPETHSARSSRKSGKGTPSGKSKTNRSSRPISSKEPKPVSSSSSLIEGEDEDIPEPSTQSRPHKYIIQAIVLRNSWPLSAASWSHVKTLIEADRDEMKAHPGKDRSQSPSKTAPSTAPTPAKTSGKKGKEKGGKAAATDRPASRPLSQQFGADKPHWILRVVSDAANADEINLKKDRERLEEIRSMKLAWETAEPGRAIKALESRQTYLTDNMMKVDDQISAGDGESVRTDDITSERGDDISAITPRSESEMTQKLTLEPPPGPPPKQILKPFDHTPFFRSVFDEVRYLDEDLVRFQSEQRQQSLQEYRMFRDSVKQWKRDDRIFRNYLKTQQIKDSEALQGALEKARREVQEPREIYKQKFLEAERRRQEEIAAAEFALKSETDKPPSGAKKSGKKSPKGSAKGKKSAAKKKK